MSETNSNPAVAGEEKLRIVDLAEETVGFGETEWHTFRDLLIRPRDALDAYLERGPTGGGQYRRPFGFYIALCGLLTFYLFLLGGFKGIIEAQPAEVLNPWIERSGKSRQDFINDVDGWMSIIGTPLLSAFYALLSAPLLIWWSGLDRRRGVRATFVLLNAWTAPMVLLGPLPFLPAFAAISTLILQLLLCIVFLRMGKGLWFQSWPMGLAKSFALFAVVMVASAIGMVPVLYISLLAGSMVG
ncbi:MAG: hypothetical protein ACKO01_08745 [Erythrobacter sp.]